MTDIAKMSQAELLGQIAREDAAVAIWNKAEQKRKRSGEMAFAGSKAQGLTDEEAARVMEIRLKHGPEAQAERAAWAEVQRVSGSHDPIGL